MDESASSPYAAEKNTTIVIFLPKMHTLNVIPQKHQTNPPESQSPKPVASAPQNFKVTKHKGNWSSLSRSKPAKDTWQQRGRWPWIRYWARKKCHSYSKGHSGTFGGIWIKPMDWIMVSLSMLYFSDLDHCSVVTETYFPFRKCTVTYVRLSWHLVCNLLWIV